MPRLIDHRVPAIGSALLLAGCLLCPARTLAQVTAPGINTASSPQEIARNAMVDTAIAGAGVSDPRVLRSMRETPRHEFVPHAQRGRAYLDMGLPIGGAQTISSPFTVAWMTQTIDPQPTDRVLEIGTGSGYQAAVLSPLVESVFTIEIVPELGETAAEVLKRLNYDNVQVRVGDGFLGWPEEAPFDKIIVTCSPENVPAPLVQQLREGGKLLIPVGERFQQTLYLMTKVNGQLERTPLQPTLFVPMTGTAEANRQVLPDVANPALINGDFEMVAEASTSVQLPTGGSSQVDQAAGGDFPGWYYARQATRVVGDAYEGDAFVRFSNTTPDLPAHLLQGIALDGRAVSSLRVSAAIRTQGVRAGNQSEELPAVVINLYDAERRDVGELVLGRFRGTRGWRYHNRQLRVPPQTREAILRIGLFGAVGTADFDDIRIEAVRP